VLLNTFAVASMGMVTWSGPQLKVMMPPSLTAPTTAAEVQLAGVPVPMTRVGVAVFTACAAAGTTAVPSGLPAGTHADATTTSATISATGNTRSARMARR
jgi:hypothetical protein